MFKFMEERLEKRKQEFMQHVRPHIIELAERGQVTHEEYNSLRMNSYERRYLHPYLTTDALVKLTRYCLSQTGYWQPCGEFEVPKDYEDAVMRDLLPLLLDRMEEEGVKG